MMPKSWHILILVGLTLPLVFLSSCYTLGTEPEYVRGKISEQPKSHTNAKIIPANIFMEQYNALATIYGHKDYKIPVGTKLSFDISNQKGLAKTVYVGPDGMVDFPLIGTIQVAGKFLNEVRSELKAKYSPFFKKEVKINLNSEMRQLGYYGGNGGLAGKATVIIANNGLRGNSVYLDGDENLTDVLFSGQYNNGITNLGLKPEWKEIGIIRQVKLSKGDNSRETIIIICNLEKILFNGDLKENVPIRNKDIVFVPRRRDSLLEELHDSLNYWASMFSDTQSIRDVIKSMEGW